MWDRCTEKRFTVQRCYNCHIDLDPFVGPFSQLHYHPTLLLFESNDIHQDTIRYHHFVSPSKLAVASSFNIWKHFIFCTKRMNLFCDKDKYDNFWTESYTRLYKADATELDLQNLDFKFTEIGCINHDFLKHHLIHY